MNPTTLPRHELAGLHAEVVESRNADLVGIAGDVVDETMQTLVVAGASGTKQVPKAAATFRFRTDGERVIVEGERLVARPARRTETTTPNKWR
ncbi:ribonuclease P [Halobacteriales archaeon QS_9_67_17]|nr:MAG: ribonuclease P [Halobacteriales archaeon QS_9_67_17]